MPRLLICEDDARLRALLARIVRAAEGLELVDAVDSGEAACELAARERLDLVLLDLELPGIDGIEVTRRLARAQSGVEILILTTFANEERLFAALSAGAAGYLVKGVPAGRIVQAIEQVLQGGAVIDPALARRFWNLFASSRGRGEHGYGLTDEELEVLTLVGRGLSNPEAARTLGASRRTVKGHLESIYRKLGVSGRVEATVKALQAGLIEL